MHIFNEVIDVMDRLASLHGIIRISGDGRADRAVTIDIEQGLLRIRDTMVMGLIYCTFNFFNKKACR